ncbi:hypothetical protein ACIPLR_15520 [Herbaspirillum huttiense]|uniref:hypothetical protein n=1 Tax=Herbaspirillum huttiense TaxID=863372 RepID=UPI0038002E2B
MKTSADWLESQEVLPRYYRRMPEETLVLSFSRSISDVIASYGIDMDKVADAARHSRFDEPDVGPDRSSSGWDQLPNFTCSSAMIRVLGAMEQYELDVLKALLYYRPSGTQYQGQDVIDAEIEVAIEVPDSNGRYKMPALWSWLKKSAENTTERRKIYKAVFGIECFPKTFGDMKPSEIKSYYQDIYELRNALAHGRSFVEISLREYCKAEAFALALVEHLSSTCLEKYKLGV